MREIETKYCGGRIVETKIEDRNGVPIGIVAGYIATWDIDRGGRFQVPDRFHKGAFLDSIAEHRNRGNRQVRLKDLHGRVIGGFPIDTVREDGRGLFGRGEVNLVDERGRSTHSLSMQGVLVDFSVGFSSEDDKINDGVRDIFKAILWEGSIVDEPANVAAQITEVKSIIPFQDLPLAPSDHGWDEEGANARIRAFLDSNETPSPEYKRCFLWIDDSGGDQLSAYRFPIADVIDGELKAIPVAISAAADRLMNTKGLLPESHRPRVIEHLERYYAKMNSISPFDSEERQFFGVQEVKEFSTVDLERALLGSGRFSRGASKVLSERLVPTSTELGYDLRTILNNLQEAKRLL